MDHHCPPLQTPVILVFLGEYAELLHNHRACVGLAEVQGEMDGNIVNPDRDGDGDRDPGHDEGEQTGEEGEKPKKEQMPFRKRKPLGSNPCRYRVG